MLCREVTEPFLRRHRHDVRALQTRSLTGVELRSDQARISCPCEIRQKMRNPGTHAAMLDFNLSNRLGCVNVNQPPAALTALHRRGDAQLSLTTVSDNATKITPPLRRPTVLRLWFSFYFTWSRQAAVSFNGLDC